MIALRHLPSLVRIGSAVAVVVVLAGCTPGGQFDPTSLFANDTFDTKKRLQGERQPVFPNGVPGAASGVPQDLVKGYQPPPDQAADADQRRSRRQPGSARAAVANELAGTAAERSDPADRAAVAIGLA